MHTRRDGSAFVRDAVLREAESVMAIQLTAALQVAESRHFLKALDAPFKPNAKLRKAMADAARLVLGHALNCSMQLHHPLGVRVLPMDALHDRVAAFYRSHGFHATTTEPARTLYLPLGK